MKLKQRNLLLFLGESAGAMSAPQVTDRRLLRAGITPNSGEAITSSALMPHIFPFLCRSQKLLLFVVAGSFQVITLMLSKTASLILTQQIAYRAHKAVADFVLQDFT